MPSIGIADKITLDEINAKIGANFGSGKDGVLNSGVVFTSVVNGPPIIKQYKSIDIPVGETVTVSERCGGLVLYSQGDVIINGTISMDGKAGDFNPDAMQIAYIDKVVIDAISFAVQKGLAGAGGFGGAGGYTKWNHDGVRQSVPGEGGASPPDGTAVGGTKGGGGGGGATGYIDKVIFNGGRGGDAILHALVGAGGASRSISQYLSIAPEARIVNGAKGGNSAGGSGMCLATGTASITVVSGAGANGPGGGGGGATMLYNNASTEEEILAANGKQGGWGGGLILIIAAGDIIIGETGKISAKGAEGGAGGDAIIDSSIGAIYSAGGGGGGGGAGGGIVLVFHRGDIVNSGQVDVAGGAGGYRGLGRITPGHGSGDAVFNAVNGSAGGNGTFLSIQI